MKKNVILVSSVAGIVLLTGAITFASTSDILTGETGHKGNKLMQDRLGSGFKFGGMHRGEGRGEGMMFWPEMGDFGGKWLWKIWSWMGMILNQQKQAMQVAIEKNDYTAYQTAYEKAKLTKEQFASMVKMNQGKTAIQTAIEKGDYKAFVAAVQWTAMESKMTENQFKDMVVKHTQRTAERAAILKDDYTAFLATVKGTPMEGKVSKEQFTTMVQREKEMGNTTK